MADSAEPKSPTEIVVRSPEGTLVTRLKDEKGRFVKKPRPLPSTKEITRLGRTLLNSAEAGPDGKAIKGTATRHRRIFDNLVRIATLETEDPKALMAVIKAAELLYLRYVGKPSASEEELEALKTSGVKIVVVQPPELVNNAPAEERKEPAKPSFLDAEIIQQN
jgi:hypothetical protein